jgi:hypothetical protein
MEYYLVVRERETLGEEYGVKVCCPGIEEAYVCDITLSQDKILALIAALIRSTVTPVSLRDVIDDWILQ